MPLAFIETNFYVLFPPSKRKPSNQLTNFSLRIHFFFLILSSKIRCYLEAFVCVAYVTSGACQLDFKLLPSPGGIFLARNTHKPALADLTIETILRVFCSVPDAPLRTLGVLIISFNPSNNSLGLVLLLPSCYRGRN